MAYDKLVSFLTGTGATSTTAYQTLTTTGTTTTPLNYGAQKAGWAELRVAGAVTGTNPTLDVTIQCSATSGGTYATVATFPRVTASTAGASTGTTVSTAIPGSAPSVVMFETPVGQPWVQASWTIGGSASPTFTNTLITLYPMGKPAQPATNVVTALP